MTFAGLIFPGIDGLVERLPPRVDLLDAREARGDDLDGRDLARTDPAGKLRRRGEVDIEPDGAQRTTSTSHGAWCTTVVLTEPMTSRLAAFSPRVPTTIMSAPDSSASWTSTSAGWPVPSM